MKKSVFMFSLFFWGVLTLFAIPVTLDYGYEENTPLYFGNPSDATEDEVLNECNFLLIKKGYTVSYSNDTLCPNWVAWHLCKEDLGETTRSDKFVPDKSLPANWYAVKKNDYQFPAYGFDRGHVCPSADRTADDEVNQETFLMTNMIPQSPDCNRIVWKDLESYERELVLQGNELYIFAGGYGSGGIGNRGYFEKIIINQKNDNPDENKNKAVNVPKFCWKIILVLSEGDDDLNRIDKNTRIICVCMPNEMGIQKTGSWEQFECSVNYIEEITHFDFFELLDDELEEFLESGQRDGFY